MSLRPMWRELFRYPRAFWLIGIETKGRSIEGIDTALEGTAAVEPRTA